MLTAPTSHRFKFSAMGGWERGCTVHAGSGRPISWLLGACVIASRHCLLTVSLFCEEGNGVPSSRFARFRIRVRNCESPFGGECGSGRPVAFLSFRGGKEGLRGKDILHRQPIRNANEIRLIVDSNRSQFVLGKCAERLAQDRPREVSKALEFDSLIRLIGYSSVLYVLSGADLR